MQRAFDREGTLAVPVFSAFELAALRMASKDRKYSVSKPPAMNRNTHGESGKSARNAQNGSSAHTEEGTRVLHMRERGL
jgi:hypothetical protein